MYAEASHVAEYHAARAAPFTSSYPRGGLRRLLGPSSFMRMTVGSRAMFVTELAMFVSRGCVLLRLFVLTKIVVMGRLMMMMCGSVMVSGRLVMMLTRRMLR
jgi:hypothetical protein